MTVRLLVAMFCLGAFAAIAQVLFVRETLVVFFGNELSIGVMFASWLLGISLGAFAARFLCDAGLAQGDGASQSSLWAIDH